MKFEFKLLLDKSAETGLGQFSRHPSQKAHQNMPRLVSWFFLSETKLVRFDHDLTLWEN